MLKALIYAKNQRVIHRDIKPANIFLDLNEDGTIKNVVVADWGESRIISTAPLLEEQLLTLNRGSSYFIAPEVTKG